MHNRQISRTRVNSGLVFGFGNARTADFRTLPANLLVLKHLTICITFVKIPLSAQMLYQRKV